MPTQSDADALKTLPPLEAVGHLLRWWPSFEAVAEAVGRYLPEAGRPERRGIYAWSSRGIPRARQLAVIWAARDDFGVMLDFEVVERMTADRLEKPPPPPLTDTPRRQGRPKRAA